MTTGRGRDIRRCGGFALASTLAVALAMAPLPARARSDDREIGPQPLTEAERAAVGLAVAYLDVGPAAWWERLGPDAPFRALGRDAALAEIEARVGPPLEAEWHLQTPGPGQDPNLAVFTVDYPSGFDETLSLTLEPGNGWKLVEIRSSIDPVGHRPVRPAGVGSPAAAPAGPRPWPRGGAPDLLPILVLVSILIAAGVLASGGFVAGRWRRRQPVVPAGAAAAIVLVVLFSGGVLLSALAACHHDGAESHPNAGTAAAAAPAVVRLGALVPLRRALADGTDAERIGSLLDSAPRAGPPAEVVRLWRAAQRLWRSELREAEKLLSTVSRDAGIPLAALLEARLAVLRGDAAAAEEGYDRVLALGPDHDGVRQEKAQAQAYLDSSTSAEVTYELLGRMGSRLADVYYSLAELAAINDDGESGERFFRLGWHLNPIERSEIFANPGLALLSARPTLFPTFGLSSPAEPRVEPPAGERHPMALPRGATATLAGELLRVSVGSGRLTVPDGWELAPVGTVVEDATSERVREEERALARLPALVAATGGGGVLAQPRGREQAAAAALTLARHNRWAELVELTAKLATGGESLPPLLARLRALALKQMDRPREAKALLYHLAKRDLLDKRRDPGNLTQLGELFAATGDYDLAIRLLRRAGTMSPHGVDDRRIRQLTLDKELATSYHSWQSVHFEVRYPRLTGEKYARQLTTVLVAERQRLQRWIPVAADHEPIEVVLFPLLRFMGVYGGGIDVVGIYDGKVRVPFADLRSLHPQLVRILTHELAHAMIAEMTHDQAPHWFQEGLAQHVEMGTGPINPIPDLYRTSHLLAFPMIDPILKGFSEPQLVELAYSESVWAIHFIESRFGVGGVAQDAAGVRGGADHRGGVAAGPRHDRERVRPRRLGVVPRGGPLRVGHHRAALRPRVRLADRAPRGRRPDPRAAAGADRPDPCHRGGGDDHLVPGLRDPGGAGQAGAGGDAAADPYRPAGRRCRVPGILPPGAGADRRSRRPGVAGRRGRPTAPLRLRELRRPRRGVPSRRHRPGA